MIKKTLDIKWLNFASPEKSFPAYEDILNYKLLDNETINNFPFPLLDKKCDDNNWVKYHLSKAVNKLFQKLYENPQYLELYWNTLALSFKDNKNVIGYELINEPWFGDIYKNPLNLLPSYSYKYNLLPKKIH